MPCVCRWQASDYPSALAYIQLQSSGSSGGKELSNNDKLTFYALYKQISKVSETAHGTQQIHARNQHMRYRHNTGTRWCASSPYSCSCRCTCSSNADIHARAACACPYSHGRISDMHVHVACVVCRVKIQRNNLAGECSQHLMTCTCTCAVDDVTCCGAHHVPHGCRAIG